MSPSRSLRSALAVTLGLSSFRALFAATAALGTIERLLLVAVAFALGKHAGGSALTMSGALALLYVARALLRTRMRVRFQRVLHQKAAAALLGSDPMVAVPLGEDEPHWVLNEGTHQGALLVAERLPSLAGDAAAAVVLVAVLGAIEPRIVLVAGAAGVGTAMLVALATRVPTARASDRATAAYRRVLERMDIALRARLEVVANGGVPTFERHLDRELDDFTRAMTRYQWLGGAASRAPVLAAAGAALSVFLVSGGVPALPDLGEAILLASALPVFVGLVQNGQEVYRGTLAFKPMATLLALPPRARPRSDASPAPATIATIALEDVSYRYPGARKDALAGVTLAFGVGEALFLRGPNGSGKSTLLRLVAALATPSGGTIRVGDADLATLDDAAFRAKVAFLPQEPFLPDSATVREALAMLATSDGAATDDAMRDALRRVEVLGALESARPGAPLDVPVAALSVGQRKRVALARLLLRPADIVLLDEPDANLDAAGIVMLGAVLRDLAKTSAVAVAAHSRALAAEGGVDVELAA